MVAVPKAHGRQACASSACWSPRNWRSSTNCCSPTRRGRCSASWAAAKVSDKIGFIKACLQRVDQLLIGGAMTYTFLKAQGNNVGGSRCEADKLDVARELLELGKGKIVLPVDHLVVRRRSTSRPDGSGRRGRDPRRLDGRGHRPEDDRAVHATRSTQAGTVVWNGPMGKFEDEPYSKGTRAIAEALAASQGVTIVGGGETAEAVEEFGLAEKMTHVSTGGGAFLEYVEGTPFASLSVIDDR